MRRSLALAALLLAAARPALADAPRKPPRLQTLAIPGDPAFQKVAKDVLDVLYDIDPSWAATAGLFDDAVRVPQLSPQSVKRLAGRLDGDLKALKAMPYKKWPIDLRIDHRWVYAAAAAARRALIDERLHEHRPAQWLEPLSNTLIAMLSYAPDRPELIESLFERVPGMVAEMREVAGVPTRRDVETALPIAAAIITMAKQSGGPGAARAAKALALYREQLEGLKPKKEFEVIGFDHYAWRLQHGLMLPWNSKQLLELAGEELARVDAELTELEKTLGPKPKTPPKGTEEQVRVAKALTRDGLLALYDAISTAHREATIAGGFVTIPGAVGPIRARETPEAMVPLTGDGGSMNPPPTFGSSNVGYWNVERFKEDWPIETRVEKVVAAQEFKKNGYGPYAAHEGFPGHHLQLSIARLNEDPLRSVLADAVQNEGWGLYAEEELWSHGGLERSLESRRAILRSYRFRIARVFYDVNIETRVWDLQQGADFKDRAPAGKGEIDEDVLRAIQWPTQLISYFAGKQQILALKEAYRRNQGEAYSDRAFHDAFLAEGSIPIALIRAKMLGETLPEF